MILECPSCGTYYDTPAIIPPEGRKVRCAKCADTWLAMPEPLMPTDSPDEPELSDSERDDADSSSQAATEHQDLGEAVASDDSTADEALGEVAAEDRSDTRISVEEEEPEPAIEDASAAALDEASVEAAMDAETAESSDALAEDAGEAVVSGDSAEDEALGEVAAEDRSDAEFPVEQAEAELAVEEAPAVTAEGMASEETSGEPPAVVAVDAELDETDEVLPKNDGEAVTNDDSAGDEAPAEVVAEEQTGAQFSVEVAEDDAPAQEAEDELPPPPEADYPIGDFSHQGMGPARSPMQEILTEAADSQPGDLSPSEGESQEAAEHQQSQSAEPVAGEEAEVVVAVAEVEALDVSRTESAKPAPASASEGEVPAAAAESEPEAAEPEPEADAEDEITAGDQPGSAAAVAFGQDFQPSTRQLASWGVLALLVVIGFTLAMVNRETIVSALPGSASFYSGLGLPVNLRGLEFQNVTSTWTMEADQPVLEVRGAIVNITDGQIAVPTVVFAIHDEDGVEVHQWKAEVTEEPLEAGGRTQFAARIPSPPASSRSVQVKFATAP